MKKLNLFVIAMLALSTVWAAPAQIDVTVNGMVCSFCAQGITKKFKAKPEVQDVKVELEHQKVYLTIKEGSELSDVDITKTLEKAGYNVDKIERGQK